MVAALAAATLAEAEAAATLYIADLALVWPLSLLLTHCMAPVSGGGGSAAVARTQ